MAYVDTYINYFRQLAVKHKDLLHDPATEQVNYDGPMDKKSFCAFDADELVTGLRTKTGPLVLCLQMFENNLSNETIYDIRQRPEGAFTIVGNVKENDFIDLQRVYELTENICYDILKKIWQDHYGPQINDDCERPFKQFRFTKPITPTGRVFDGKYGWYVEFAIDFKTTVDITRQPEEGTFID